MIDTLEIRNFKSIKELSLPCKRFNLFIGEPGAGKSNLLEALGLLSFIDAHQYDPELALDGFVRHERTANLFYNGDTANPLLIGGGAAAVELACREGQYRGLYRHSDGTAAALCGDDRTLREVAPIAAESRPPVRFYRAPALADFRESDCAFLLPPAGRNFPSLLAREGELRYAVNLSFRPYNLSLELTHQQKQLKIKSCDGDGAAIPYSLAPETLRRMAFYIAAIDGNRNAALVFEEPEVHSFPGDAAFLAEAIALEDNLNQYFITTHSPYFLMTLLGKAQQEQLSVNLVYGDKGQTKVKTLPQETLPELYEGDIFSNIELYLAA